MQPQHFPLEDDPAVFQMEAQLLPPLRQFDLDLGLNLAQLLHEQIELRRHVVPSHAGLAQKGHGTGADATLPESAA